MPKIYLSKSDYERDFGKGALEKKKTLTGKGTNVRTQPYVVDRNRTDPNSRAAGFGKGFGQKQEQQQNWGGGRGGYQQQQQPTVPRRQQQQPVQQKQQQQNFYDDGGNGGSNQRRGFGNKTSTAVSTAKVLVASGSHPRKEDIRVLLQAYEKGWVADKKFSEELQKLVF